MLYSTYPCKVNEVTIDHLKESYEIPDYDGARVSKLIQPGKLLRSQYDDVETFIELMERGCRVSENGPCVGWRSSKSEYSWISYREFLTRAKHFGSGLINLGVKLGQMNCISIYAQNSIQWLIAQYGSFYYSSPVVPLYDSIGLDARNFMINKAGTQVVVCDDEEKVKALLEKSKETLTLKYIICMNLVCDDTIQIGKSKGIEIYLFSDVEELGKTSSFSIKVPKPDDVALISFTSGTTGNPKGAILTHQNIVSGVCGILEIMGDIGPTKDDVSISYLPLAHVYEQLVHVFIFIHGGRIGYFSGDISMLTDDMRVLQPTIFVAVPRVLNKLYDKVQAQIRIQKANKKTILSANEEITKDSKVLSHLYKAVSDSIGGKVRLICSAAAPISENVLSFFRSALNCQVMEVYGATESGGPVFINIVTEKTLGSAGVPVLCCMVRLEDVPEMGYFKKNLIGEVCIKGNNVFKGYLNEPQKTLEAIDEDGWLSSGDIGMWLPNGTLKIVDRKKNIFKISQGEYIAPEKIESIYLTSMYVSQILVYGDSLQSFLVAIIIPEQSEVVTWCKEHAITETWKDVCKNHVVKQMILEDIQQIGKTAGLFAFQQVKDIYLHPDLLTVESGLVTPTQKIKRNLVQKIFMMKIQEMYEINSTNIDIDDINLD